MTKLLYINLKFIIPTCILFRFITTIYVYKAEDFELKYYRNGSQKQIYLGSSKVEIKEHVKFKINGISVTKSLHVYKIHIPRKIDDGYENALLMSRQKISQNFDNTRDLQFRPKTYIFHPSYVPNGFLICNLSKCGIGITFINPEYNSALYSIETSIYFYIMFTKSNENDNLVLKFIPKLNKNKYIFRVIVCPSAPWLTSFSNSEYIETSDNFITNSDWEKTKGRYVLKYMYCNESGVATFVKCGYLKQMFMPSIDVGYECTESNDKISLDNNEDVNERLEDEKDEENNLYSLSIISISQLMCKRKNIVKPSSLAIAFLPPGNIYKNVNAFKISRFTINTKLYSGHMLDFLEYFYFSNRKHEFLSSFGYEVNYKPECKVPPLNATLRLKINGIVQEFKNKVNDNFVIMDIYKFDRKEIRDASIGCHAVPDEMENPAFSDFYELLYPTSLLMFDEATGKFIEVNNIDSLVSNRKYKCTLKDMKSKNKTSNYIRESEFIINLTEEYLYIWIIFVIFILVTALLIVGLVIYKKIQSKKKKRSSSSSTSSSISSSQSTTNSTAVVSEVTNIPILQDKNVAAKSTNMGKNVVSKNANISNKVTNPGQKVDAKNSNPKLINQVKIAPKKVVGKNSNPKKISNMDDSVFKVK